MPSGVLALDNLKCCISHHYLRESSIPPRFDTCDSSTIMTQPPVSSEYHFVRRLTPHVTRYESTRLFCALLAYLATSSLEFSGFLRLSTVRLRGSVRLTG